MVRSIILATALVAVLVSASPALAQGGAPAPDFTEPCPALYPGDSASKERIARWMARRAAERGLPHELPVMAALAESGLRNLRGDRFHGFFGMHDSLNSGEYRGFPGNPELQLSWFIDAASTVRQRRVAQLESDPGADEQAYGSWIADVERPAPQNRSGYQPQLDEARRLVAGKCAAPVHDDVEPPRLLVRITTRQHPRAAGGIALSVRCPDADCLSGAMATVTVGGRDRTMRAAAIEPPERGYGSLIMRLPRVVRRELAGGQDLLARVAVCAADTVGNPRTRRYPVRLLP